MAVADKKIPPSKLTGGGAKSKSEPKPKPPADDEPWKLNETTGRKERQGRLLTYEKKLRGLFAGMAGTMQYIRSDTFSADVIRANSDELAYGYARLAQENPQVKRALEFLFKTSALGDALLPTATVLLLILWHYEILVPNGIGVPLATMNGVVPTSREAELHGYQQAREAAEGNGDSN